FRSRPWGRSGSGPRQQGILGWRLVESSWWREGLGNGNVPRIPPENQVDQSDDGEEHQQGPDGPKIRISLRPQQQGPRKGEWYCYQYRQSPPPPLTRRAQRPEIVPSDLPGEREQQNAQCNPA